MSNPYGPEISEPVPTELRPCAFHFGDGPDFDGMTDGSTSGGFANVWVSTSTRDDIVRDFEEFDEEPDLVAKMKALEPEPNGFIALAGETYSAAISAMRAPLKEG